MFVIILFQNGDPVYDIDQVFVTEKNSFGVPMVKSFNSFQEAADWRELKRIDGQIIELPQYEKERIH